MFSFEVPLVFFFSVKRGVSVTTAKNVFFDPFINEMAINDVSDLPFNRRIERYTKKKDDFDLYIPTCDQMNRNSLTPFVVFVLYKSSGRFLGMGSIIDKQTVLTAAQVVGNAVNNPPDLIILAGRLGPWWGKNSQVRPGSDVYINEAGLALIITVTAFKYGKHVAPIRLPLILQKEFDLAYGTDYAVFGVPRSSWNVPGEPVPKTSAYVMKIEHKPDLKDYIDACKALFPKIDYNETTQFCTTANASYCWGVLGSPGVAVSNHDQVLQISVVTTTSLTENDNYHLHTKVEFHEKWIMSISNINYNDQDDY